MEVEVRVSLTRRSFFTTPRRFCSLRWQAEDAMETIPSSEKGKRSQIRSSLRFKTHCRRRNKPSSQSTLQLLPSIWWLLGSSTFLPSTKTFSIHLLKVQFMVRNLMIVVVIVKVTRDKVPKQAKDGTLWRPPGCTLEYRMANSSRATEVVQIR